MQGVLVKSSYLPAVLCMTLAPTSVRITILLIELIHYLIVMWFPLKFSHAFLSVFSPFSASSYVLISVSSRLFSTVGEHPTDFSMQANRAAYKKIGFSKGPQRNPILSIALQFPAYFYIQKMERERQRKSVEGFITFF